MLVHLAQVHPTHVSREGKLKDAVSAMLFLQPCIQALHKA